MSEVEIKVDLDLDEKKAKQKLNDFKQYAEKEEIKIKIDLDNAKVDSTQLKNILSNAFKIDKNSINDIKKIEESLKNIKKAIKEESSLKSGAESKKLRDVKEYLSVAKKIVDIESKIYKNDKNGTTDTNDSLNKQIALLRERQAILSMDIRSNGGITDDIKKQIGQQEKLQQLIKETSRISVDESSRNKSSTQLNKTYQDLDKIQEKLNSMKNSKGFLDDSLLSKTNSLLSETRSSLDANGISSDFDKISNSIREMQSNISNLSSGNTLNRQEANFNVSLESMRSKLESFKNSVQELRGSDDIVQRLESSFRGIDTSNIERATVDLRQFGNELQQAQREARQLESSMGRSFFGNFGSEFRDNLFTFTAGELLADGIRNVGHSLKTLVMEYDTAMANLKKVANPADVMNVDQLDAIEQKAVSIAKNVGQSSQDVIQAIADTTQMGGYGMEQATQIAEQTMMLANVAELTQEVASKGVVTMMSAFKLDPLKEMPVVVNGVTKSTDELTNAMDKLNYVGNNFAISSGGILDAITSGANVLAEYGTSMTDTVAMITASNTTLQDTSRIGNGLKTIQVRLAGIKSSAKDGTLSLNKTAMTLKEIAGINVFSDESKGEIKGMAEIVDELGAKWEGFTDKQKAGLSEAIAGANQAAVFQSLMSNFDVMKQVQSELNEGMHFGSALAENEQYIDSLHGKLNTLKETWVGIFNTVFSSNAAKTIVDGLISISEAISGIITMLDKTGLLTPMLLGLGAVLASKAFTGLPNLFRNSSNSARGFGSILPSVTSGLTNMAPPATRFGATMVGVGTNVALASGKLGTLLGAAAPFIPWVVGAAVATGGLIAAVDYFTESLDEEKQRLNETIGARKEEIASIDEQKGKLQGLQEEYDSLSNKPQKTAEEVSRLTELTKQLAEIRPDLVVGTDSNGNPILSMTGDVKDLIEEMDRATESKKKLLSIEQEDLAKNSIKQLHGSLNGAYSDTYGYANNANSEMGKLENMTSSHVMNMNKLEKDRDKILNKLYDSTGKERQKILKDLEKANYNIEKEQSDFAQKYQQQLDVVKEYSDKIGEGIFASLENSSTFKNMDTELQGKFSKLKSSLDFSDIKTEDQLLEVEMALSNLMKAASNGDIDIDKISKSLEKANAEFAKTGDAEKYGQTIDKVISDLEKATGKDFSMLKDVFEGMDTSILKGKDALDEFLRAYGKTRSDLNNNDGFAKALANQKRQIEQSIEELNGITGDAEIDLELAYNIVNNNELPMQVRDMVRVLLNKGFNPTDVLKVAQQVLVDLSDGEVDIASLQKLLDEKFGEGAFEITPEIMMSDKTKIAGVETVINQLNEKFGELPPVVKTVIETEGVTAYNSAKSILETYNSIPEEVRTNMSNNGLETLGDIINVKSMLDLLPSDVVMNIVSNFPDVVNGAGSVQEIISSLPSSVLLQIQSNYPEVVENSKLLQDAIDKIPATKESVVSVKEEVNKSPGGLLEKVFGKNQSTMTATAVINTQVNNAQAITDVDSKIKQLTTNGKAINVKANTTDADGKISSTKKKIDDVKQKSPAKINVDNISANNRLKTTKGHIDAIKSKSVTVTVNTNYTTTGSPTSASSGVGGNGKSAPSPKLIKRSIQPINIQPQTYSLPTSPIRQFNAQVQSDTISMQRSVRAGIDNITDNIPTTLTTPRATISTPIAIGGKDIHDSLKYGIDLLKELDTRLKDVADRIALVNSKMKHATYKEKLKYLEEENKLYKENISILQEQSDAYQKQKNYYEYFLKNKGFSFNIDGNMTNYEEKILEMEREKERLEKLAEDKNKASSEYKGKDDKQKDKLSKSYDDAKKKADDYGKSLDEIKKFADEYYKVAFDEMPKVEKQFVDLNNSAKDTAQSIKDLKNEMKELGEDSSYKNENRDIDDVQNKLDKNDIELETAVGERRKKLLEERIQLQQQLKKETQDLLDVENQRREVLMTDLGEYGFEFRDDGSIVQYSQVIKDLKENLTEKEFDEVFEKVESYLDSTYKKIPKAEQDLMKLGDTVKKTINELQEVDIAQIDKDIERADESELLDLLKKKKELQEELVSKKQEYMNLLNEEGIRIKDNLLNQGVKFDENDNILNLDDLVKQYEDAISKTNDSARKKQLEKELDGLIAGTEAYVEVTEGEIPKAIEQWKDAQYEVKKTDKEIQKIEEDQAKFAEDRADAVRKATEDIMKVTQDLLQTQMDINKKQIDMLEKSMKLATFNPYDTYEALEKQISLLEKQMSLQKQMGAELEKQRDYYKDRLVSFGVEFDSNGIATNAEKLLSDIQNQMASASDAKELSALEKKFNDIVSVLGDYNGALKDVIDSQGDLLDLQLEVQSVYENMLQTAKSIEDRITKVLEKQVEERKKLIDEETKKRIDAIKKQQDAYNKKRDEDKYEKEYQEKLDQLAELKAKIDAVSKDTSLSGQAKLAELLEELKNKQDEFDDFVQDKLDKEINDMFDKEMDKIQEDADKAKEELDKGLEKEELYETIKDALETGKLVDIDGNIIDLKDALLEYEDKYGDGLSVIGGLLKKDILSELDVSLDVMKNIESILKNLNISDFYKANSFSVEPYNINSNQYPKISSNTIQFNESLITVQGNVTPDVMPELKNMIKQAEKEITRNIIKSM